MSSNMGQNMKNVVHIRVNTLKKADESFVCSDKTWKFLQMCIITFKSKSKTSKFLLMNK
jgi:hypothetical protein